jgi:hypothetical protein
MRRIFPIRAFPCAFLALVLLAPTSRGEFIITFSQNGNDVVANGTGSINLAALKAFATAPATPGVVASIADVTVGGATTVTAYNGFSGPTSFGPGAIAFATTATGQSVSIIGGGVPLIAVFNGYKSGDQLTGSATWANSTFSSLGLTPGTYEWTWGTGANADDFIVQIGPATVPAPSSLILAGTGLSVVGLYTGIRRRRAAAAAA